METRVPILKIKNTLIVPIQVDLDDRTVTSLQHDILTKIEDTGASGVIIDISVLDVVDSYLGRMLGDTALMAGLMDAKVVLSGMQPLVALTLVELGLNLNNIETALDMEQAIELIDPNSKI
jgi:rsbT antagonist protein RsbS